MDPPSLLYLLQVWAKSEGERLPLWLARRFPHYHCQRWQWVGRWWGQGERRKEAQRVAGRTVWSVAKKVLCGAAV